MPTATNAQTTTDRPDLDDGWEYVGDVAVDSGQLLLIDPGYDRPSLEAIRLSLAADQAAEVPLSEHQLHTAVTCSSGWGDGRYPVFIRRAPDGAVAELNIVFIEEEE